MNSDKKAISAANFVPLELSIHHFWISNPESRLEEAKQHEYEFGIWDYEFGIDEVILWSF